MNFLSLFREQKPCESSFVIGKIATHDDKESLQQTDCVQDMFGDPFVLTFTG
jgi:hypothetical protein